MGVPTDFLRQGDVAGWNKARAGYPDWRPALAGEDLSCKVLTGANLAGADLRGTDLRRADLRGSDLRGADLTSAKLWGTLRDGWLLDGITCESADWFEEGDMALPYGPGDFVRLHGSRVRFAAKRGDQLLDLPPELFQYMAAKFQGEGGVSVEFIEPNTFAVRASPFGRIRPEDLLTAAEGEKEALRAALAREREELNLLHRRLGQLQLSGTLHGPLAAARVGEVGHYTVLKTDIRGYSRLDATQRVDAEEDLDAHGARIFKKYECEWANDAGDALIAVFPNAVSAARAALELVDGMKAVGLTLRVGLASGMLTIVGRANQGRLSFQGPALIEAARLEPVAKEGEVLVAGSVPTEELRAAGLGLELVTRANAKAYQGVDKGATVIAYRLSHA